MRLGFFKGTIAPKPENLKSHQELCEGPEAAEGFDCSQMIVWLGSADSATQVQRQFLAESLASALGHLGLIRH